MSSNVTHNDQSTDSWVQRLSLNLLSYLIVIVPIGLIVIATRCKLLPRWLQSNALIQRFVYGTEDIKAELSSGEDAKQLLNGSNQINAPNTIRKPRQSIRDSAWEFLWCLFGLQISYLIWGLLQERIMTTTYARDDISYRPANNLSEPIESSHPNETLSDIKFHDSQFLVFINRLVAFITAILGMVFASRRNLKQYTDRFTKGSESRLSYRQSSSSKPQAPFYKYIYCSLSNIMSSWSQYEALKYVNFPTQCLSKSCKVIPVMLMSRVLLRQRHSSSDYCCACLLALGMFIFLLGQPMLNNHHEMKSFEHHTESSRPDHGGSAGNKGLLSGLTILALYLTFDSFTSNWQQSLYTQYEITNWQMMAAINFYSILLTLTSLHHLGGLKPAIELLASSSSLTRDCLAMSIMSSIGQMFVYYTIKRFGSVLFAVIMTLRQFLSILISIVVFSHQITFYSIVGLILVFSVAGYQVYHKSRRDARKNAITSTLSESSQREPLEIVHVQLEKSMNSRSSLYP